MKFVLSKKTDSESNTIYFEFSVFFLFLLDLYSSTYFSKGDNSIISDYLTYFL